MLSKGADGKMAERERDSDGESQRGKERKSHWKDGGVDERLFGEGRLRLETSHSFVLIIDI